MAKKRVTNSVMMIGEESYRCGERLIDFFLLYSGEKMYAFSRTYRDCTWELCKNGIRVNALLDQRNRNKGIMKLVDNTRRMMPYLIEYYDLPTICA